MSDQIDQFGRDKSKPFSDDKSKKILESLAEIRNQLENKDYTPKVEVHNNTSNRDVKSIETKNLNLDQLQQRIEFIEEKLITLKNQTPLEDYKTETNIKDTIEFEKSISIKNINLMLLLFSDCKIIYSIVKGFTFICSLPPNSFNT